MNGRRIASLGVFLISVVVLQGCATGNRLSDAQADYQQGQFNTASRRAADVATGASGETRDQATYLAGVAAYRAGDFEAAEGHLTAASRSGDSAISGRASATLGLMYASEERHAPAADHFQNAAENLEGDEGALAARRAAESYRSLGRTTEANEMLRLASTKAAGSAAAPASRTGASYALQLGAFSREENAREVADAARTAAVRAGLGSPRIEPEVRNGQTLHFVRIGSFTSRYEAQRAKSQLGQQEAIVVAAGG